MSGFEVAGIILGAFPIVMKLLENYGKGWQTLEGLYHHGKELSRFHRDLEAEWVIFRNICDNLLESLDTSGSFQNGRPWDSPDVQHVLEQRLNARTANAFIGSVKDMNDVITTLRRTYPADLDAQAKLSRRAYAKMVRKRFKFHVMEDIHKNCLEQATKINTRLQLLIKTGSHGETSTGRNRQAAKTIKFYHTIRQQAIGLYSALKERLEPPSCYCAAPHETGLRLDIRDFDMRTDLDFIPSSITKSPIRFRAFLTIHLSGARAPTWQAIDVEPEMEDVDYQDQSQPVNASHIDITSKCDRQSYGDRLAPVPSQPSSRSHSPLDSIRNKFSSCKVRFGPQAEFQAPNSMNSLPTPPPSDYSRISTSHTNAYPARSISPHKASPAPIITILCQHLITLHISPPPLLPQYAYLEMVQYHITNRLRISPALASQRHPRRPATPPMLQPRAISFSDIFNKRGIDAPLSLKYQLQLAVRLASSILQLHSTGWLNEEWDSSDILFLEDSTGQLLLDSPIVGSRIQRRFYSGAASRKQHSSTIPVWCTTNHTLLSLGIVLLELWHGRSFGEYEEEARINPAGVMGQQIQGYPPASRKIYLACYMAKMLKDNAGSDFESAVRGRVKELDVSENSLDNSGYMEAVYTKIACPLKQALEKAFPKDADI